MKRTLRLIVNDGKEIRELFWLKHIGEEIYYGLCDQPIHSSFHRDGTKHWKLMGKKYYGTIRCSPLKSFKGQRQLDYFALADITKLGKPFKTNKKQDKLLMLDLRTRKNKGMGLSIHLIESGRTDLIPLFKQGEDIHIVTDFEPWIVISVM